MAGKILISNLAKSDGPIAALFGWGNGRMQHLIKYSNIFESQDFTTVCLTTPLVHFYMRPGSLATVYRKKIVQVLQKLTKTNPTRPIILMAFSQAGSNVMASMFQHLENSDSLPLNVVGTIFDSGPMMYERLSSSTASGAVWSSYKGTPPMVTKIMIDGIVKRVAEYQKSNNKFMRSFDSTMMEYSSLAPQLFLCSSADKLMNYRDIVDISKEREQKGVPVYVKVWDDCDHIKMFRDHPNEYKLLVNNFINVCLEKVQKHNLVETTQTNNKQRWIVELLKEKNSRDTDDLPRQDFGKRIRLF